MLRQMLLWLLTDVRDVTSSQMDFEISTIDGGTHKEQMCMSVCRTRAPVIIISEWASHSSTLITEWRHCML